MVYSKLTRFCFCFFFFALNFFGSGVLRTCSGLFIFTQFCFFLFKFINQRHLELQQPYPFENKRKFINCFIVDSVIDIRNLLVLKVLGIPVFAEYSSKIQQLNLQSNHCSCAIVHFLNFPLTFLQFTSNFSLSVLHFTAN